MNPKMQALQMAIKATPPGQPGVATAPGPSAKPKGPKGAHSDPGLDPVIVCPQCGYKGPQSSFNPSHDPAAAQGSDNLDDGSLDKMPDLLKVK